ncbi:MAG: sensor histidine kinase efflux regulator BaeS [Burkholderiaceae bacterium]|nr:sensor histidine kinase efflux regulator BaeS [Burkholderiaceae bacterium]
MKPGITLKLFCVILLTCIIAAFSMLAAMRYSFQQGFLGFLNEQEAQRLESVLPRVEDAYREHGNWEFLREQPRQWMGLIRPEGMHWNRHHRMHAPGERPPALPESELTGVMMRFSLLDSEKRPVVGHWHPDQEHLLKPIDVDGQTVGWVALVPFQQVTTGAELRFHQQQLKAGWIIGGIAIVLAAIAAWLLARMFLAPLKRIAASTHRLAEGDYATRVPLSSTDELGHLAEDFNRLALTLEKNEKLRRNFMADISHELRTPLSVLKGEMEAMEDGIRPMSLTTLKSLQAETATLGKLVDDLYQLSLSDVGALAYRKTCVDVIALLLQTVASFEERFAGKSIVIDLHFDTTQATECDADPLRLQQMFSNLLENTLRYTDPNGRLEIGCSHEDGVVRFDFQDTAPGVPSDKLPHLFERFYRTEHSRNRATGGSGLGLAISRNIAEAHQGSMTAQASPLGGLWISVVLPLAGKVPA